MAESQDAAASPRSGRTWLRRAGSISSTVLAVIVLAELGLRLFAPLHFASDLEDYIYDQELGLRLKPNLEVSRLKDFLHEGRTNTLGTVNFEDDLEGYDARIFALGDSHTMGIGVPADASFPFFTSLMLNRDEEGLYAKRYGVANLAMAAFGGEQSLLCLKRYAKSLGKPRFVLYLGDNSDAADDALFKNGYRHRHKVEGSPRWGLAVKPIRWILNTQLSRRIKAGMNRPNPVPSATEQDEKALEGPSAAERQEDVLKRIAEASDELGATFIVSWSSHGRSYEWAKAWAQRTDAVFADWHPAVQSVQKSVPALPLENTHSAGHPRTWVNYLIAEAFVREIRAVESKRQR